MPSEGDERVPPLPFEPLKMTLYEVSERLERYTRLTLALWSPRNRGQSPQHGTVPETG